MFADRVIGSSSGRASLGVSGGGMQLHLRRSVRWLAALARNHTTRRYLREMDDRMLSDIGISRTEARSEAARWMWDSRTG